MGSAESSHDHEVAHHGNTPQQGESGELMFDMNAGGVDEELTAREINDLRVVFSNIAKSQRLLELRNILKLPEMKAQIAEGDISIEDLESVWLEACTVNGVCSPKQSGESWGVRTGLSFEGFVHFLRLCEERVTVPKDMETPTFDTKAGRNLVTARHRMVGLVRATVTLHNRGGVDGEEGNDQDDTAMGEKLHMSMVRATVEDGLAQHTPDTLRELMRRGVYKASAEEAELQREKRDASLEFHLSKQSSHDELVRSGILVERTPEQLSSDRRASHDHLQRTPEMDSATGVSVQRDVVPDLDALGTSGAPAHVENEARQYRRTQALLQQELDARVGISELQDKGIYRSREVAAQETLEKAMLSDKLSQSLRHRPFMEDLMDRGVLEASALESAFKELQGQGPVTTPYDILKWPVVAAAVEEGAVKLETLEEAFAGALGSGGSDEEGSRKQEGMSYEEFDTLLSSVRTSQVEDEPQSLKLWAIMRMRPAIDEQDRHESNKRRNALMAAELEQELGKREPLERLANKGIYVDKTPTEAGVERAYLMHALAHGLKHRSRLEELAQKGVYLEGVESGDLEESHRDARNTLEGTLSRRPDLSTLEENGYLEADELEEEFLQLVLEHRHQAVTATPETATPPVHAENHGILCLPAESVAAWSHVRAMVESGAAEEDDVTSALQKAQRASMGGVSGVGGVGGGAEEREREIDFVGFLEFVHNLDLEVDGLEHAASATELDPEAKGRHMRRLEKRRERSAQASKEEMTTHGTLKEHLLAHLRSRPARTNPETQRIAKEFHPAQAVALEKSLVRNHLESHLRSLTGGHSEALSGSSKGERAARVKELEFKMNKRMLMHRLTRRSSGQELLQKGILHKQSAQQENLQRLVASDALKHALETRPSLQEVKQCGVYVGDGADFNADHEGAAGAKAARPLDEKSVARAVASGPTRELCSRAMSPSGAQAKGAAEGTIQDQNSVGRHDAQERLEHFLGNPLRPSKQDLLDQGIYLDATPQELKMSHYLAARNVKHGLEGRETVQDLKNQGVYLSCGSNRAAHEKLLVKALLRRKLKHAFSQEELAQLKQKGIYKEAEHERLEEERALVTSQLARLVSRRPHPDQLEREHPELLEAGILALVFEERVMPRFRGESTGAEGGGGGSEQDGGPEHVVSFDALMTWPDVKDHMAKGGLEEEEATAEMAQHFRLCDADSDGFLTFSQFLRWVELCDLNPEDHVQVFDRELETEFSLLIGEGDSGVSLDAAASCRFVKRWVTSASLGREELEIMWGEGDAAEGKKNLEGFKKFCRQCETRSSAAHNVRLEDLQNCANIAEAKAKQALKSKLAARLSARPDLEELKKTRIYRLGGLDPATELLERNLIANDLKQQLLARPALEDLEKRGIKPNSARKARRDRSSSLLAAALDSTMRHDDAKWRMDPSTLGAGPRAEVSALLQASLSKRLPKQELRNKGIYIVDTDANYALLVHKVLETYLSFKTSSSQLAASLSDNYKC